MCLERNALLEAISTLRETKESGIARKQTRTVDQSVQTTELAQTPPHDLSPTAVPSRGLATEAGFDGELAADSADHGFRSSVLARSYVSLNRVYSSSSSSSSSSENGTDYSSGDDGDTREEEGSQRIRGILSQELKNLADSAAELGQWSM